MWALGIRFESSARAANVLNHWAIFLASRSTSERQHHYSTVGGEGAGSRNLLGSHCEGTNRGKSMREATRNENTCLYWGAVECAWGFLKRSAQWRCGGQGTQRTCSHLQHSTVPAQLHLGEHMEIRAMTIQTSQDFLEFYCTARGGTKEDRKRQTGSIPFKELPFNSSHSG